MSNLALKTANVNSVHLGFIQISFVKLHCSQCVCVGGRNTAVFPL